MIAVNYSEFATIPDINGEAARLMHFVEEPGTKRLFVSVMTGGLYSISYDGKTVTQYLDLNATQWAVSVQSQGSERGVQSFAFHPQFSQRGTPGYGKFYTYIDTSNITPAARLHDAWQAHARHGAARMDGEDTVGGGLRWRRAAGALSRRASVRQPQRRPDRLQPAGQARATPEFGLLYLGFADGGNGGDPMDLAQNMSSAFGKILRIDPLGKNSANGKYGIPESNPFVKGAKPETVKEIYAVGVRNPQRFSWDSKSGTLYLADIGQNAVEEISPVTSGANLGWNKWEASFPYVKAQGQVDSSRQRDEAGMTWPVVEFDHRDPLFQRAAITGVIIYRQTAIPALEHLMIFGDNPSGQIFYVDADKLPNGGQAAVRQILFNDNGTPQDAPAADSREEQAAGQGAGRTRRPAVWRRPGPGLRDEQARRRHSGAGPLKC